MQRNAQETTASVANADKKPTDVSMAVERKSAQKSFVFWASFRKTHKVHAKQTARQVISTVAVTARITRKASRPVLFRAASCCSKKSNVGTG